MHSSLLSGAAAAGCCAAPCCQAPPWGILRRGTALCCSSSICCGVQQRFPSSPPSCTCCGHEGAGFRVLLFGCSCCHLGCAGEAAAYPSLLALCAVHQPVCGVSTLSLLLPLGFFFKCDSFPILPICKSGRGFHSRRQHARETQTSYIFLFSSLFFVSMSSTPGRSWCRKQGSQ